MSVTSVSGFRFKFGRPQTTGTLWIYRINRGSVRTTDILSVSYGKMNCNGLTDTTDFGIICKVQEYNNPKVKGNVAL